MGNNKNINHDYPCTYIRILFDYFKAGMVSGWKDRMLHSGSGSSRVPIWSRTERSKQCDEMVTFLPSRWLAICSAEQTEPFSLCVKTSRRLGSMGASFMFISALTLRCPASANRAFPLFSLNSKHQLFGKQSRLSTLLA